MVDNLETKYLKRGLYFIEEKIPKINFFSSGDGCSVPLGTYRLPDDFLLIFSNLFLSCEEGKGSFAVSDSCGVGEIVGLRRPTGGEVAIITKLINDAGDKISPFLKNRFEEALEEFTKSQS